MKLKHQFIMALVWCTFTLISEDQTSANAIGKTGIGIQGGVNMQTINGKDANGNNLDNSIFTGFNLGLKADLQIAPGFFFQTGLLYTTKGAKNYTLGGYPSTDLKLSYLEVPLHFLFKPLLGNGHLLLGFGSYLAYGIAGSVKYGAEGSELKQDITFKNTISSNDPQNAIYLRRMDTGINMLAGYEFANKISLQLNTQLGLAKSTRNMNS